jgi:hypothetical protein
MFSLVSTASQFHHNSYRDFPRAGAVSLYGDAFGSHNDIPYYIVRLASQIRSCGAPSTIHVRYFLEPGEATNVSNDPLLDGDLLLSALDTLLGAASPFHWLLYRAPKILRAIRLYHPFDSPVTPDRRSEH